VTIAAVVCGGSKKIRSRGPASSNESPSGPAASGATSKSALSRIESETKWLFSPSEGGSKSNGDRNRHSPSVVTIKSFWIIIEVSQSGGAATKQA
jgi:hypothetical protein